LPLSVPETLPPPVVTIEIEALEPGECPDAREATGVSPPVTIEEPMLAPPPETQRARMALLSALPVVVGIVLWLLWRS
jgi:hypothetical protein